MYIARSSQTPPPRLMPADQVAQRFNEMAESSSWVQMTADGFSPMGCTNGACPIDLHHAREVAGELAADPAKGNKITRGTLEEAAVALMAERCGVFAEPVRETTGEAEFVDNQGRHWDVKSPLSPPPDAHGWYFDAHHQLEKVRHDFSQGDRVLLNLTRCVPEDANQVLSILQAELSPTERGQLAILVNSQVIV